MPETKPDTKPDTKARWPYTSFKTFLNLLAKFEETQAIPPQIDRSVLGGSEGQKTQVLATLRFFRLITNDGTVEPLLESLVMNPKDRPKLIREMLAKHYPEATALAHVNATTKQLEETFTDLSGDTLRKAMTFYLHAAKYAKHPVSKHFKVPHGQGKARARRSKGTRIATRQDGQSGQSNGNGTSLEDAKARYVNLLLEKAKGDDGELNDSLLDRIERLLGFQGTAPADDDVEVVDD